MRCDLLFLGALTVFLEGDDEASEGLFHGAAAQRPASSEEESGANLAMPFLLVLKCGVVWLSHMCCLKATMGQGRACFMAQLPGVLQQVQKKLVQNQHCHFCLC